MIELEFSALSRLCLNRCLLTIEKLDTEVLAWITERDRKRLTFQWQFSVPDARHKLNSHRAYAFQQVTVT